MNPEDFSFDCPRCQIGRCHPTASTYTRLMNGQVISVPNISVYVCDVCGYQEYERDDLLRLQALLGAASHGAQGENRPTARSAQPDAPEAGKSPRPKP